MTGLDVIIVSFNTREDVLRCLESLATHPPAGLGTVFLVDNASIDGTVAAVAAAFPKVVVVPLDRNVGFAAANNVALGRAQAPWVLLLNSDTVVGAGAIDTLLARAQAAGAVAAGPKLVDGHGRPEISFGSMLTPLGELIQRWRVRQAGSDRPRAQAYVARRLAREREVDWVSGACLLVERKAAIAAGLLDTRYFMYEEDVDFCAALRARGGRVLFTPAAVVTHLRGRSVAGAPSAGRQHYDRSHLAFYEKHAPGWARLLRLWQRLRGRSIR
jgi:GT2 family glycosyltransferase